MPPAQQRVPLPSSGGEDAWRWLASVGLPAVSPPIRSSDLSLSHNPLLYYLRRRLMLVPKLSWSEALSRGSWFHLAREMVAKHGFTRKAEDEYALRLRRRLSELKDITQSMLISEEGHEAFVKREVHDHTTAWGWLEAWSQIPISKEIGTIYDMTGRSCWRSLGREILVKAYHHYAEKKKILLVGQLDELLLNKETNTLWILDDKTCSVSPAERLQTCATEGQTHHYINITQTLLERGILHESFELPDNVKLGGMLHIGYRKPQIKLGKEDRPFEWHDRLMKGGPDKGKYRREKRFTSEEPDLSLYIERCTEWLLGVRQYEHLRAEREADPCVNVSTTFADKLDPLHREWYSEALRRTIELATRQPHPGLFSPVVYDFSRSPYKPFVATPITGWPTIVRREHFMRQSREESLTEIEGVEYASESSLHGPEAADHGACDQAPLA